MVDQPGILPKLLARLILLLGRLGVGGLVLPAQQLSNLQLKVPQLLGTRSWWERLVVEEHQHEIAWL